MDSRTHLPKPLVRLMSMPSVSLFSFTPDLLYLETASIHIDNNKLHGSFLIQKEVKSIM